MININRQSVGALVLKPANGGAQLRVQLAGKPTQINVRLDIARQGPAGAPGLSASGGVEFPFAWGDASPRTITIAAIGKLVYGVQIHISTAFNGAGAALTVGDSAQADRLMSAEKSDPAAAGTYTASPTQKYGSATPLLLTITPGAGASAGAGLLTIFIET